jgi:hypothetical protein
VRSALFWLLGASFAFFLTGSAFLVLANFGTAPRANDPIPQPDLSDEGSRNPELALSFSEEELEALERRQDQTLTLSIENRGEGELKSVDMELAVYSEDKAYPRVRRYRETVAKLAPGEVEAVELAVDLSPPRPVESLAVLDEDPGSARQVLEARAYAPGAAPVVKTAVVAP